MLETLLKRFRSYGMEDLEFMIVNSKLSHSQDKLHELTKRVSFAVYQETEEEEVWDLMEGGKDDMFVYDRCGRLTYYIPFPLSILNESPLVSNAILATYFKSPCGENCEQNKTVEFDEFVKNIEGDYETENVTTTQENFVYTETEQPFSGNETTNETTQFPNDLYHDAIAENNVMDILNSNTTANGTDYYYPTYENNFYTNETNSTNVDNSDTFFNSIYKLFFNGGKKDDTMTQILQFNVSLNATSGHESKLVMLPRNDTIVDGTHRHHTNHDHEKQGYIRMNNQENKKSDRCLEADYEVCRGWSKRRLLHAQKCCSGINSDPENQDQRSCHNFGKKRCKKMQSILKCCIKTDYKEPGEVTSTDEPTTLTSQGGHVATLKPADDSAILQPTAETVGTQISDVVCCKPDNGAKLCRVSYTGLCEEGEHVERSPNM